MERRALTFLHDWLSAANRKPLILRGARQVGKTWLVRTLAQQSKRHLIEINFERNLAQASLFQSNNPQEILKLLSATFNQPLDPDTAILFLDEIQAAPELIAKLRWFAEEMPQLPVVAAGSLLEFTLADHTYSMPVGRVNFAHIEPMSFEEFLLANGRNRLVDYLASWKIKDEIPEPIHLQLLTLFKEYLIVGGMPAAVLSWSTQQSFTELSQIHQDLLATYRNDFSKYQGRLSQQRLEEVLMATPRMLGQKFVLSQVNPNVHSDSLKQAISLLNQARVCHRVQCAAANGLPLGSETKEKFFKEIFLDVGLACAALGLNLSHLNNIDDVMLVNSGAVAEQVVGQLLRTIDPFYIEPELYYWINSAKGSEAELDYVIAHAGKVVPIEVKAGATGTLKSLQIFMKAKQLRLAVRIYGGAPQVTKTDYTLISLPVYLTEQLHRVLDLAA